MHTRFDAAQLADPATASAAGAIRSCVHCGFCTATCPTYVLLGDELDSPRGRIYLVKEMLETSAKPTQQVVKHLDRCLSCLACETHCPSGVSYRRIIDTGRAYVEQRYRRPLRERLLRSLLAATLPYRGRMRAALLLGALARPLAGLFERTPGLRPLATLLALSGASARRPSSRALRAGPPAGTPRPAPAQGESARALRVGLFCGCVGPVLAPEIDAACERLLQRAGAEVVRLRREGCCGALAHHLGRDAQALAMARAVVDAWDRELKAGPLAAIVVTASGCGTQLRDYGHLLRDDPLYAAKAARVAALACDVTELIDRIGLPPRVHLPAVIVGYHAACSLQHGQKVQSAPVRVLTGAGFEVRVPADAHLCCGSAGVYNILQPAIAAELGARKAVSLAALAPDVVAAGNIGCMVQIGKASGLAVVHVAQLLDWATGGPAPDGLEAAHRRGES